MTIRTLKELYSKNKGLDRKISRDFNLLIRKVHTQLSTKKEVLFIQVSLLLVGLHKVLLLGQEIKLKDLNLGQE